MGCCSLLACWVPSLTLCQGERQVQPTTDRDLSQQRQPPSRLGRSGGRQSIRPPLGGLLSCLAGGWGFTSNGVPGRCCYSRRRLQGVVQMLKCQKQEVTQCVAAGGITSFPEKSSHCGLAGWGSAGASETDSSGLFEINRFILGSMFVRSQSKCDGINCSRYLRWCDG